MLKFSGVAEFTKRLGLLIVVASDPTFQTFVLAIVIVPLVAAWTLLAAGAVLARYAILKKKKVEKGKKVRKESEKSECMESYD